MSAEVAIAYLALARLGCIVLPLFADFGVAAIAARLNDAQAVAVITTDGCLRRGRSMPMKTVLDDVAREVPSLRHIVVASRLCTSIAMQPSRDVSWRDVCARGSDAFAAIEVPAEHP